MGEDASFRSLPESGTRCCRDRHRHRGASLGVLRHRFAMCLTTEERESQPDRQAAACEEYEGREHRRLGCRRLQHVAGAGDYPRLNGPMILPAPLAPWPRPEARAPMRTP